MDVCLGIDLCFGDHPYESEPIFSAQSGQAERKRAHRKLPPRTRQKRVKTTAKSTERRRKEPAECRSAGVGSRIFPTSKKTIFRAFDLKHAARIKKLEADLAAAKKAKTDEQDSVELGPTHGTYQAARS